MARVRLGIVGCGAVSRMFHIPAALQVEEVVVAALVDPSEASAKSCAHLAGCDAVFSDWRDAVGQMDVAVVATPLFTHAEIVTGLLENGIDVLCEKPLAATASEVDRMTEAAGRCGRHLAVGMMRRLFPNMMTVGILLGSGALGKLSSIAIEEGDEFSWPVSTPYLFGKAAGTGVLLDTGIHVLDCLVWWFGEDIKVVSCQDDGWHGPAANAFVRLLVPHNGGRVPCTLVVSSDRQTSNRLRIEGCDATLDVEPIGSLIAPTIRQHGSPPGLSYALHCDPEGSVRDMLGAFVRQIEQLVDARLGRPTSYTSVLEARGAVALAERAGTIRTAMKPGPWVRFSGTLLEKDMQAGASAP